MSDYSSSYEDKNTRAGTIKFSATQVKVSNHALDRFIERGDRDYDSRKQAFYAMARVYSCASPSRSRTYQGGKVPRDTVLWDSSTWRFAVDEKRKVITTCYKLDNA